MSNFIDDEIVEAACKAITLGIREWMRLSLKAALPLIGEKLAHEIEIDAALVGQRGLVMTATTAAARIRELTGAKQ